MSASGPPSSSSPQRRRGGGSVASGQTTQISRSAWSRRGAGGPRRPRVCGGRRRDAGAGRPGRSRRREVDAAGERRRERGRLPDPVDRRRRERRRARPRRTARSLLAPLRDLLDQVPEAQATALAGALGWSSAAEPPAPLLVAGATLALLSAAAADGPLLVVVDDAHWLDRESASALLFAVRRMRDDPVAFLLAARGDSPAARDLADLPALSLGGLTAEHVREAWPELVPDVAALLADQTLGNPLVLGDVVPLLSSAQRAGAAPLPVPLPVGARPLGSLGRAAGRPLRRCRAPGPAARARGRRRGARRRGCRGRRRRTPRRGPRRRPRRARPRPRGWPDPAGAPAAAHGRARARHARAATRGPRRRSPPRRCRSGGRRPLSGTARRPPPEPTTALARELAGAR